MARPPSTDEVHRQRAQVAYADSIRTPVVSEDGLTLYFLAQVTANGTFDFDIYSASRATTSDGFGVATALLNVNLAGQQARYPDLSEDGLELYFSANDRGPIMVATRSNVSSAFSAPSPVRTGVAGNFASISGNKLALYYIMSSSPSGSTASGGHADHPCRGGPAMVPSRDGDARRRDRDLGQSVGQQRRAAPGLPVALGPRRQARVGGPAAVSNRP